MKKKTCIGRKKIARKYTETSFIEILKIVASWFI